MLTHVTPETTGRVAGMPDTIDYGKKMHHAMREMREEIGRLRARRDDGGD